eukprot:scaffold77425_cov22-Tisochrysis_lutea.AAC.1
MPACMAGVWHIIGAALYLITRPCLHWLTQSCSRVCSVCFTQSCVFYPHHSYEAYTSFVHTSPSPAGDIVC